MSIYVDSCHFSRHFLSIAVNKVTRERKQRLCEMTKITNRSQFGALVDLLESNLDIARGFQKSGLDRLDVKEKWIEFTKHLNALGPPSRNVYGWMKVWVDLKYKIRKKIAQNKYKIQSSGGEPNKLYCFTALEERVINMLNMKAAFDSTGNESDLQNTLASSPEHTDDTETHMLKFAKENVGRDCEASTSMDTQSTAAYEPEFNVKTPQWQFKSAKKRVKNSDKACSYNQLLDKLLDLQKEDNAKAEEILKYTKTLCQLKETEVKISNELLRLNRAKHQLLKQHFKTKESVWFEQLEIKKAVLELKRAVAETKLKAAQ